MPTWLAIAIPSVVAVAAILMWALDYSKKAHEIAKLRLELEKLKREDEEAVRSQQSQASGLYKPTAVEVERFLSTQYFRDGSARLVPAARASVGCRAAIVVAAIVALIGALKYLIARLSS